MGKILKITAFLSLLILSLSCSADTISIEIPQPTVRNESGILYYEIEGFHSTLIPDMPKLPFRTYFFEIPFNADNVTVSLSANPASMGRVENIRISKQVVIATADKKLQIRKSSSGAKIEKFPNSLYSVDGIRQIGNHRVVAVSIYPMQYDVSTKELEFYGNISIEISYGISNSNHGSANTTPLAEKIAGQIIYEYNSSDINDGNSSEIRYVIITTPEIADAVEPLKDWKTKKGVPAEIYTTDWIYTRYNGTLNYVFHSGTGNDLNNLMETIIDLRNVSHANLSFSTFFNIEYGWDFGYVEVSANRAEWIQLNGTFMTSYRDTQAYVGIPGVMAYTGNSSWIRDTINLGPYTGNRIYLRFRYVTDTYVSHGGWYIDNITINSNNGIIASDNGSNSMSWELSGFGILDINARLNPPQKLIRDFIRDMANNGTEWILLAGDDEKIPALRVQRTWYEDVEEEDNDVVPTDYFYGELDGNWNSDNDEVYGENDDGEEISDWLPDVYVGRLPTSNMDEMEMLVSKILKYEKNPNMTKPWFRRAVLAAGESDELTDEGYLKKLIAENFLNDYNITRLYYRDNYKHEYPLDYQNVKEQLSIGQSIVNLAGHGSYSGIARCLACSIFIDTETNPSNGDMLPLVYADSCNTGAFDQENNLGKTAIMNWAIGYIGSSRTSYYVQEWKPGEGVNQEMDYRFWEQFSNGSYRPGEALFKSKAWYVLYQLSKDEDPDAAKKNLLDYNLLGDPEIPIWTDIPNNFIVNFTDKIYAGRQNISITVRDSVGRNIDSAVVAIQKGKEIYEYKKTNADGRVEFTVNISKTGELNITVTKHNFLPYEGSISIISDTEPPIWTSIAGIGSVKVGNGGILVSWGSASDISGVRYNLYYSTTNDWLPFYSNNLTEVKNSAFDFLVLDPDGFNSSDIQMLRTSGKFLLSYIDIGNAEKKRNYWNSSREWILDNDSELQESPVDYSNLEWQGIIMEYIKEIKSKSFNGIYIDGVEDGNSDTCGNCTRENMIKFIGNISLTYRSYNFSIFAQDGLDIAQNVSDYLDGFCSEGTYYHGTMNMTEPDITQSKEEIMNSLLSEGKLILTLDYTENESEIDFVYNRSEGMGYVPYISKGGLENITINRNHEPKSVADVGFGIENVTSPYQLRNLTNGVIYYLSVRAVDNPGNEDKNNVTIVAIPSASLECLMKGDKDCNGKISDFEILNYIERWAKNSVSDFDLLEAIGNYQML